LEKVTYNPEKEVVTPEVGWDLLYLSPPKRLPVSSIYIWSRNLVAQSEASFVLTAHTKTIERDWN
jgi:hypothetical protein